MAVTLLADCENANGGLLRVQRGATVHFEAEVRNGLRHLGAAVGEATGRDLTEG